MKAPDMGSYIYVRVLGKPTGQENWSLLGCRVLQCVYEEEVPVDIMIDKMW